MKKKSGEEGGGRKNARWKQKYRCWGAPFVLANLKSDHKQKTRSRASNFGLFGQVRALFTRRTFAVRVCAHRFYWRAFCESLERRFVCANGAERRKVFFTVVDVERIANRINRILPYGCFHTVNARTMIIWYKICHIIFLLIYIWF